MSTLTIVVEMDQFPSSNHRGHWRTLARKRAGMRVDAKTACLLQEVAPIDGPVHLTVTFAFPDRRRRDLDNYEIKSAIDGIVDAGVISDDRSTVLRAITRRPADHLSVKGYAELRFDLEAVS
jgi:Holliday junction resolvase RusA-like endonuclease